MSQLGEDVGKQDQLAIQEVLAGNVEAYRRLVLRHSARLFRVAFRITGNGADADEVVQEALLRGYQRLASFEEQATFGSWIYRIAVNCSLDLVGRRRREAGYGQGGEDDAAKARELPDRSAGQERLLLSRELGAQQERAMRALTDLERTAFVMRHVEEQSTAEIAAALQIAPNAAKQAVFRAVQKMRQRLGSR